MSKKDYEVIARLLSNLKLAAEDREHVIKQFAIELCRRHTGAYEFDIHKFVIKSGSQHPYVMTMEVKRAQ